MYVCMQGSEDRTRADSWSPSTQCEAPHEPHHAGSQMNKCIPEVVKTMLACITSSIMTGRLGSEYLTCTLQDCKMICAPLADFVFASADSGQVSPVAQLAEEGDETPWYGAFQAYS